MNKSDLELLTKASDYRQFANLTSRIRSEMVTAQNSPRQTSGVHPRKGSMEMWNPSLTQRRIQP